MDQLILLMTLIINPINLINLPNPGPAKLANLDHWWAILPAYFGY